MSRRAVLLDRDGTLVEPRHYPSSAADLVLSAGIEQPLRRLQAAGFVLAVVTNQSGIARGYFSLQQLEAMHRHLSEELRRRRIDLTEFFACPHHPEGSVPEYAMACGCRKPMPGLLLSAAERLDLDLGASWFVGDILDDVEAGRRAGCRTALVDLGTEREPAGPLRTPDLVSGSTADALGAICAIELDGNRGSSGWVPTWSRAASTGRPLAAGE